MSSRKARVRTAELYHRGFETTGLEFIESCKDVEFTDTTAHIDFHRPELYAMLARPVNDMVEYSLDARQSRPPFGLIRAGVLAVPKLPPDVSATISRSLRSDMAGLIETDPLFYDEFSPILDHMNAIDVTNYTHLEEILCGGINTMTDRFDSTYGAIRMKRPGTTSEEMAGMWRVLLPQAMVSLPEVVQLGSEHQAQDELIEITTDGAARFCQHAIRSVVDTSMIPDREPIGCPITFRPELLRELWAWYVKLRQSQSSADSLAG